MVGLRIPLSPLWFLLGLRFRVKAFKVSGLPFSPCGSVVGLGFRGFGLSEGFRLPTRWSVVFLGLTGLTGRVWGGCHGGAGGYTIAGGRRNSQYCTTHDLGGAAATKLWHMERLSSCSWPKRNKLKPRALRSTLTSTGQKRAAVIHFAC